MFGAKNPFNQKPQQNVLREFDSAAAGITSSVNTLTSSIREELSFIDLLFGSDKAHDKVREAKMAMA
jgi:hypothetical protein